MPAKSTTNILLPAAALVFLLGIAALAYFSTRDRGAESAASATRAGVPVATSVDGDRPVNSIIALRGQALKNEALIEETLAANEALRQELAQKEEQRKTDLEALQATVRDGQAETEQEKQALIDAIGEQLTSSSETMMDMVSSLEQRVRQFERVESDAAGIEIGNESRRYASGERIAGTEHYDIVFVRSLDERAAYGGQAPDEGVVGRVARTTNGLASGGILRNEGVPPSPGSSTVAGNARPIARTDPNVRSSIARARQERADSLVREEIAEQEEAKSQPFFTLPDMSVLGRSSSLTALYGKVYPDDDIVNPAPIKIIVGRENLTANFKQLPAEIEGMIFGGYAVGDRTGACVTGNLTAALFVFTDGTVRNAYVGDPGARPANKAYRDDSIGYITDPWGNPCIPGKLITDAPKQLLALTALGAAEGYARALRQQEIDTSVFTGDEGTNVVETVSGSASAFARANGISSGLEETTEWLRERYGKIFEAYYVPAGVSVAIHLEQELRLDKAPDARQIRYQQQGKRHARLD